MRGMRHVCVTLEMIIKPAFTLFQCNKIATKAVVTATQ